MIIQFINGNSIKKNIVAYSIFKKVFYFIYSSYFLFYIYYSCSIKYYILKKWTPVFSILKLYLTKNTNFS